jgi:hypothetical protein
MGALDARAALRVAADLVIDQGFAADALAASFTELARRGQVGASTHAGLCNALSDLQDGEYAGATQTLRELLRELLGMSLESIALLRASGDSASVDAQDADQPLDYRALLAQDRARAKIAKLRVLRRR